MPYKNKDAEEEEVDWNSSIEIDEMVERDFRYVFCRACGGEMRHSPMIICSDCLGDEVDRFYKVAIEDDEEGDEYDEECEEDREDDSADE